MEIPLPLMNNEPRIPSRAANDLKTKGEIIFRHPGYHSPTNVLLTLAKADCEDCNGTVVFGLHHGTALLACQIIANNAFNSGYLAMDSAGSQTFLFARFAWAIIQGVKPFLTAGIQRRIVQVDVTETGEINQKESNMEGSKLQESYAGGGSKSATPLKRKAARASEKDDSEELSSDDSNMDADFFWEFEVGRSGKRRMHSSDDTVPDMVPPLPEGVQEELEASAAAVVNSQNLEEVGE
ncbi:hypothetical protein ACHAPX_009206 [Trichoderma viride]